MPHNEGKMDTSLLTFLICMRIDSADRQENVETIITYIRKYFSESPILLLEVDKQSRATDIVKEKAHYLFEPSDDPILHRTAINNKLIKCCNTPFGIIWDTDVIIPPLQVLASLQALVSRKHRFALPYDGRFLQVDVCNKRIFMGNPDIDFLESGKASYMLDTAISAGGAFMFSVKDYQKIGGDNPNIHGWGHEDAERVKRIHKLGFPLYRSTGPLYHLTHTRQRNSYFFNEQKARESFEHYFRTCSATREELQKDIAAWTSVT